METWLLAGLTLLVLLLALRNLRVLAGLREAVLRLQREVERQQAELRDQAFRLKARVDSLQEALRQLSHQSLDSEAIPSGGRFEDVDPQEAETWLEDPSTIIVDVREPFEFAAGHLPGALLVPLGELQQRLSEIPSGAGRILVNCASGQRSQVACQMLCEAGYSNVYNLAGGIKAWRGPVERGAAGS